jgi:hypothetical protein
MPEAQIKSHTGDNAACNNEERQKRIEELRKMIEGEFCREISHLRLSPRMKVKLLCFGDDDEMKNSRGCITVVSLFEHWFVVRLFWKCVIRKFTPMTAFIS